MSKNSPNPAAGSSVSAYWDDLSWASDSASVRRTLADRGYYLASEGAPGIHRYVGPNSADVRVAFIDGSLARVSGTLKPTVPEAVARTIIDRLEARFGAPDSLIRNQVWLPPDSARKWERWPATLAFAFIWHRPTGRTELRVQRLGDDGAPLLQLITEAPAYTIEGVMRNGAQRLKEYLAAHPEFDQPILLSDADGPLDSTWTLLDSSADKRASVQLPLKRQTDGSYLGWVRFDYSTPEDDGTRLRMVRTFIDCPRHRYRVSHYSTFARDGSAIEDMTPLEGPENWHEFNSQPTGASVVSMLCPLIRAAK